jgi:hypothetical protein
VGAAARVPTTRQCAPRRPPAPGLRQPTRRAPAPGPHDLSTAAVLRQNPFAQRGPRHGARGLRHTAKPVTKRRRWLAKTPCNDIITARHDASSSGSRNARLPVATHARA